MQDSLTFHLVTPSGPLSAAPLRKLMVRLLQQPWFKTKHVPSATEQSRSINDCESLITVFWASSSSTSPISEDTKKMTPSDVGVSVNTHIITQMAD